MWRKKEEKRGAGNLENLNPVSKAWKAAWGGVLRKTRSTSFKPPNTAYSGQRTKKRG